MEREMATSFYSDEELQQMGFAHVGHDVMISRKASIYGASNIWIGNHVRVDDFCVLSGKSYIREVISMCGYHDMFGGTAGITFEDYTGIHRTVQLCRIGRLLGRFYDESDGSGEVHECD